MVKCVAIRVVLGKDSKSYFLLVNVDEEFFIEGYNLITRKYVYLGTKDPKGAFDKAIKSGKILEFPEDRFF